MSQADLMMDSEADAWFARNRSKLGKRDPVSEMIESAGIKPKFVLEVGSCNGWRLRKLRDKYGCIVFGVEPGMEACIEAAGKAVPAFQATAAGLPANSDTFDLVIYGFCLYLCDPADWFKIVAEGDRVLKTGGHLIVHDFAETAQPFARPYEHREGILSYHYDFAKLWHANPLYHMVQRRIYETGDMVTVLKKGAVGSIEVRS